MQDIILLHGALGSKEQLLPLAEALKEKYKVHLISFSGHGGVIFPTEDFSIPLFADEVLSYLHQEKMENTPVFGYSMGGYIALYLAKEQPGLLGKIITLGTKFHWDSNISAREVKMLDADTIEEKVPAYAAQLKERHSEEHWKEVLSKTKQLLLDLGKNNALSDSDYVVIKNQVLVLLGENDKMVTVEESRNVAKALSHGSFKLLPGTPHPLEQVDVELLASVIDGFLSENFLPHRNIGISLV